MQDDSRKITGRPLLWACWLSLILAIGKGAAFGLTGSTVVLASFYDSTIDSLVSGINYWLFRLAREGPDREHPFGHGGFEVISSLVQGVLIAVMALSVIYTSITRLIEPSAAGLSFANLNLGVATLVAAGLGGGAIQWLLGRYQQRLSTQGEHSLSLNADRGHYLADLWSNLAGAAGLTVVLLTEEIWLDALFGILGAGALLWVAIPLLRESIHHIVHREVAVDGFQQEVVDLVLSYDSRIKGIHRLRTRRLGPTLFIDFHLKLPKYLTLAEAHSLGDQLELEIVQRYPNADVLIHFDPEDENTANEVLPTYET
jgi:ferrous-iron efflux pump FieF